MKEDNSKNETEAIQFMIHQRLQTNAEVEALAGHPDEDTLCAFIEGHLEENAASEMVSHLIACSSCRRITAQVTRFDAAPDIDEDPVLESEESEPGRFRQMLENLASKVFPSTGEDVVFAYHNPPEESSTEDQSSSDTDQENESGSK